MFPIWVTYITFENSYNIHQSYSKTKDNDLSISKIKEYAGSTLNDTDQNIKSIQTRNILRRDK